MTLPNPFDKAKDLGLIIDTNLLVVLCVGCLGPDYLQKCKRTQSFDEGDYMLLLNFTRLFSSTYVSPQILAELSNHLDSLKGILKSKCYLNCESLLRSTQELYIEKDQLLADYLLPELGFTDLSIMSIALSKNCSVVTTDGQLYQIMSSRGINCANFNHLRANSYWN